MLLSYSRAIRPANAPSTATGVLSNTLNGSDQLSYSAAKIRNTNKSARPRIWIELPCEAFC
jgi:hypothetical protein